MTTRSIYFIITAIFILITIPLVNADNFPRFPVNIETSCFEISDFPICVESFNFSDENPLSVLGLVKKIYQISRKTPNYKILNIAKYEIRHQYLSSKKARKVLGWKPKVTFNEGIKKTIKWYKDYFNKK